MNLLITNTRNAQAFAIIRASLSVVYKVISL